MIDLILTDFKTDKKNVLVFVNFRNRSFMFMCLYFHIETKIRKMVHVYMVFFKQTSTPHPQGQIETLLVGIYKHTQKKQI